MTWSRLAWLFVLPLSFEVGCVCVPSCPPPPCDSCGPCVCCKKKEEPPTLFEWAIAKEHEDEGEDCDEDEDGEENGEEKNDENGKEGNSCEKDSKKGKVKGPVCYYRESVKEHRWRIKQEEPIAGDRPDFTEHTKTVGRGIVQLEAGYTFIRDTDRTGTQTTAHSYPEMLFRIGMFADWFEWRIGQNLAHERTAAAGNIIDSVGGGEDLYLGIKLALTDQEKILPETAIILQMTVPTGHEAFTGREVLPGVNYLYTWELIEDFMGLHGGSQANRAFDGEGHYYVELAQSISIDYELTHKLSAYTEWFAFFPTGSIDPLIGPEYYFDGGFTYLLTKNFQLDIRAGVGLNRRADNFFAGSGFVARF